MRILRTTLVAYGVCLAAQATTAQTTLTLAETLARVRERAPEVVGARLAIDEARARLVGASLRLTSNPELAAAVGNRQGSGTRFTDFELGLGQLWEPGARRAARMRAAAAGVDQGSADLDETIRIALYQAASAFVRALHASERLRLLTASETLASGVYDSAERRFRAGDIAVLDVNLARASLARIRAEREAARAGRTRALGELQGLLGSRDDIAVEGQLDLPDPADLNDALNAAQERPELRVLEAAIREAEAGAELGRSFGQPDYGLGVRYGQEEGDHIVLGGMTLTLPVFAKGQELRAVGAAAVARVRAALDAGRTRVELEVRSAFGVHEQRLEAARLLQREALPGLDENEALASRSFEVGQLGLPDLLLIRREILETRLFYLDTLLEAAQARIDLDASAALLR
jgi:cobalt-zinc-cadmium efflux system outer membrane protein